MKQEIKESKNSAEFYTEEGCHILETWNTENDNIVSIARARVEKGVTTKWHLVKNTFERYLIIKGKGLAEIGEDLKQEVKEGDLVFIPEGCRQRITNIGNDDLIFYCICTPRFLQENYVQTN